MTKPLYHGKEVFLASLKAWRDNSINAGGGLPEKPGCSHDTFNTVQHILSLLPPRAERNRTSNKLARDAWKDAAKRDRHLLPWRLLHESCVIETGICRKIRCLRFELVPDERLYDELAACETKKTFNQKVSYCVNNYYITRQALRMILVAENPPQHVPQQPGTATETRPAQQPTALSASNTSPSRSSSASQHGAPKSSDIRRSIVEQLLESRRSVCERDLEQIRREAMDSMDANPITATAAFQATDKRQDSYRSSFENVLKHGLSFTEQVLASAERNRLGDMKYICDLTAYATDGAGDVPSSYNKTSSDNFLFLVRQTLESAKSVIEGAFKIAEQIRRAEMESYRKMNQGAVLKSSAMSLCSARDDASFDKYLSTVKMVWESAERMRQMIRDAVAVEEQRMETFQARASEEVLEVVASNNENLPPGVSDFLDRKMPARKTTVRPTSTFDDDDDDGGAVSFKDNLTPAGSIEQSQSKDASQGEDRGAADQAALPQVSHDGRFRFVDANCSGFDF